jgi:CcmD family protein
MQVIRREAGMVVWTSRALATALAILTVCAIAHPVFAQQPDPQSKPTAAQDQFVPVDRPMTPGDTLPAPKMLAAAYAFVWVVLFLYLWSIRRRLATVEREMASVSRRITPGGRSV